MNEESNSLIQNNTWELVYLPPNRQVKVGLKANKGL
jgi:hypothetical protein